LIFYGCRTGIAKSSPRAATLLAPHPQPFSPEYRGEGSQSLFMVEERISNFLNNLDYNIFIRPALGCNI